MVNKKQYYVPGKEYEWTKETWETTRVAVGKRKANNCGPFEADDLHVKGESRFGVVGQAYQEDLDIFWEFMGYEEYFNFTVNEEGVEIPEYLIPFYGENTDEEAGGLKKETLSVEDLVVGKEYIMSIKSPGVIEDCLITYWAQNQEVIFATNLKYHTYEHFYVQDINHFREVPEKTREEKLSEKYKISLDIVNKMVEDGVIV